MIGLLAESLSIMTPNEQSLKAYLSEKPETLVDHFANGKREDVGEICDYDISVIK